MRILFTGIGRRVELIQAFRDAATVLNKELLIYGADMAGTAPALAYCNYERRVVSMHDPAYIDQLLAICIDDKIDLLIPTIDTDLLVLSKNRERFEAVGTKVLISAADKIQICRDKNRTFQFFVDCGLSAPATVHDWKDYRGSYPAFIKPKDGSSSINAFKVENEEELKVYANQIDEYIIQPFVSGHEYTIDIFCDWEGTPVFIVPRERLRVREGEVLKTQICMDAQMIEEAKRLCKAFHPCGPMTVQLIRDAAGVDWFIEINPRYGGGAPLSMKAGARSAETVLKLVDGEAFSVQNDIADGTVYSRFDQSVCIENGGGKIKGVIFDLDDTLYSEKEYVRSGFKAVSDYLGGGFEEKLWRSFEAGRPAIDDLLKELGREADKEKAVAVYRGNKPDIHLYPAAARLINDLKARGIKVGIITDGRPEGQRSKINALSLDQLADDIIVTDELGGAQFRKPCDIAYRIIQLRWRLPCEQIIYIGDNMKKDLQAAKQLGMQWCFFRNPDGMYSLLSEGGVSTFEEIEALIHNRW